MEVYSTPVHVENSYKPVTLLINIYIEVGANSSGGQIYILGSTGQCWGLIASRRIALIRVK